MEENNDIETVNKEVEVMLPFFGMFHLTRTQRILHAQIV